MTKEVTLTDLNAMCYCLFFPDKKHSHCRRCNKILHVGSKVIRSSGSRPVVNNAKQNGVLPYLCKDCLEALQN